VAGFTASEGHILAFWPFMIIKSPISRKKSKTRRKLCTKTWKYSNFNVFLLNLLGDFPGVKDDKLRRDFKNKFKKKEKIYQVLNEY